jgi:hypothetical protein
MSDRIRTALATTARIPAAEKFGDVSREPGFSLQGRDHGAAAKFEYSVGHQKKYGEWIGPCGDNGRQE